MKLTDLSIRNFRCVGAEPLRVSIDRIVVLIGPNNAGKSTVLDAYQRFVSGGEPLELSDFAFEQSRLPVEIGARFVGITKAQAALLHPDWLHRLEDRRRAIAARWVWSEPHARGVAEAWVARCESWVGLPPGTWEKLFAKRCPLPLRITPEDDPKKQEDAILSVLIGALRGSVRRHPRKLEKLLGHYRAVARSVLAEVETDLTDACGAVETRLRDVFPSHRLAVQVDAAVAKPEEAIRAGTHLRVVDPSGRETRLARQGSGLKRAFLWSAIAFAAERSANARRRAARGARVSARPRILLLDEPEAFLHPSAVRGARDALYALAEAPGWQVVVSTHSPVFLDVSRPHTTIVRVERAGGEVATFSTDAVAFDEDERKRLQMIKACHPSVNEFFFAERVLLVEGDTEQMVLGDILASSPHKDRVHIVNCLGKANLIMFARILNHFRKPYVVLHDADSQYAMTRAGKRIKNPAWTINRQICEEVAKGRAAGIDAHVVASIPDFEREHFGAPASADKPYRAWTKLRDPVQRKKLAAHLDALLRGDAPHAYREAGELARMVSDGTRR